jgi:hypothetical protein
VPSPHVQVPRNARAVAQHDSDAFKHVRRIFRYSRDFMLELMRLQPVEWNDPHNRDAKKEMVTTLHKYFEVLR